jgi:hypothetical protein
VSEFDVHAELSRLGSLVAVLRIEIKTLKLKNDELVEMLLAYANEGEKR